MSAIHEAIRRSNDFLEKFDNDVQDMLKFGHDEHQSIIEMMLVTGIDFDDSEETPLQQLVCFALGSSCDEFSIESPASLHYPYERCVLIRALQKGTQQSEHHVCFDQKYLDIEHHALSGALGDYMNESQQERTGFKAQRQVTL